MIDEIDKRILRELQADAGLTAAMLGERVGLSAMPAWRRVQKLEEAGYIRQRVAVLDRNLLGYGLTAFVFVKTSQHNAKWFAGFRVALKAFPEIVEFHRLTGEVDFLLKVVLRDMDDYRAFYNRLIEKVDFADISTSFAFETFEETLAVPVGGM